MCKLPLLTIILCMCTLGLFSQTYKMERIYHSNTSQTYLSHLKSVDSTSTAHNSMFSLWGYQLYGESTLDNVYEVEYFKGDANQMYDFLSSVVDFCARYNNQDLAVTNISGVKVKTIKWLAFKYTCVFEPEGKVMCKFNEKQWRDMLAEFTDYRNSL